MARVDLAREVAHFEAQFSQPPLQPSSKLAISSASSDFFFAFALRDFADREFFHLLQKRKRANPRAKRAADQETRECP